MLIRQSNNTYIRCSLDKGYIYNQLTRHDRVYDAVGCDFLKQIERIPKSIDDIVNAISQLYNDVSREVLTKDFLEFAEELAADKFLVMGNTIEELDEKDTSFTYSVDNPKTLASDFTQETKVKISENTQDYFLESAQQKPKIRALQFELSSRCNERCIHCYIPNKKKDHGFDMPLAKVKSVLDEFAEMGGIFVTLSGGEAFLHKDLMEIVRYCREKDLGISILSNLINLKDNDISLLKEANVSLIQTSLYSMHAAEHDAITTVPGSFEKTKRSIEKLVAADIPVQISCPLMKANYKHYDEVLEYAKSLKIKAQTDYIIMARANLDKDNLANRLSLEETEVVLRQIMEHDIDYRIEMMKKRPLSVEIAFNRERYLAQPVCGVGYDNCCIAANGDVYPCAGWQGYVLGNIYKQSLKELWEDSEKIKGLRKITNASFPQCIDCEARDFCAMCLVRNFNENDGDMFKVAKHFCDVAFLNKRLVEEYELRYLDRLNEVEKDA